MVPLRRQIVLAFSVLALLAAGLVYYRLWDTEPETPQPPPQPLAGSGQPRTPSQHDERISAWRTIQGFDQPLAQFNTVFWEPADTDSLRQLIRETPLVRDKTVLEIGTGTGLLSLYCLKAGAARVIATDVNPAAIENARFNARRLGLDDRFTARLVPRDRPTAFRVIRESERFDLIISNPPWENQKPQSIAEYALYDENFLLMETLLEGLEKHLEPGGTSLLAYGVVDAIRTLKRLAPQHNLDFRVLDDRHLDDLPTEFLPGMLLEVKPNPQATDGGSGDDRPAGGITQPLSNNRPDKRFDPQ